ncbi:MAG: histidinol-phosphatase [Lachnospiraceae bacterium]|nr:histidinol-phosphatase [Lachnospiraceae bacterium]
MICNFHTHSTCCDGRDTPEELAAYAFENGFSALGFSSHSYIEVDEGYTVPRDPQPYKDEIARLKDEYRGRMEIYCGLEQDIFTEIPAEDYDYVIGSVHFVEKDGEMIGVDYAADLTRDLIDGPYCGDFDALAEDYFELVAQLPERTGADIIGHFDLVSKYNDIYGIVESTRYLDAAWKAIERLIGKCDIFEINTGGMASGYKNYPYPSPAILSMLKEAEARIMLSSDAHKKEHLLYGFNEAAFLAREAGFTERLIITEKGFEAVEL